MMGMIRFKRKLFVFISLLKFSYPFSGKEANSNLSEYGQSLGTNSRMKVMLMLCVREQMAEQLDVQKKFHEKIKR